MCPDAANVQFPRSNMQKVNLGLVGVGTVGGGVLAALDGNGPLLASRLGLSLDVARMAVRDPDRKRPGRVPAARVTTEWREVVHDPSVQIVTELMGGTTIAREVVLRRLWPWQPVVRQQGPPPPPMARNCSPPPARTGANLYQDARRRGNSHHQGSPRIPVGNRVLRIAGIVNGTCNYILTRMKLEGADFDAVLSDAQRLGYAEADPTLDVDGHDAAHKTGILASLAHGFWIKPGQVHTEGIRHVSQLDIQFASRLGYTIRLLGIVKLAPETITSGPPSRRTSSSKRKEPRTGIQVSVYPALVPNSHVLASVNHAYNAVSVRGDVVGDTLFYGRGAGSDATASSVLSDLADAALDLKHGSHRRVPPFVPHEGNGSVTPLDDVVSRYYVRLSVLDQPGVFARIAGILAKAKIGISSIIQPEGHEGEAVPVILMIHDAPNAAMRRALATIARLPAVRSKPVMIRVETLD